MLTSPSEETATGEEHGRAAPGVAEGKHVLIAQRGHNDALLTGDIRQLTGLRGIVALDVAVSHYGLSQVPGLQLLSFALPAVDLFFCLSGFTLCLVYGAGRSSSLRWRPYIVARFARVYPLYLLTTLVTLWYGVAWQVGTFPQRTAGELLAQFTRQATLLSEIPLPFGKSFLGPLGCWNDSAWSISVEAVCYVTLFPTLFPLTRYLLRRAGVGATVLAVVVLGATCFVIFEKFFTPNVDDPGFPQPAYSLALWVPLIRGVTMFSAGWLAYTLYLAHREASSFIGAVTDTLALAFLATVASERYGLLSSFAVVIIVPFLILGLMNAHSFTARLLSTPPIHYLGVISYSLYLWHVPCLSVAQRLWPWRQEDHLHGLLWPLALSMVASIISYHGFEMPMRRAIRHWMSDRPRSSGLTTPA